MLLPESACQKKAKQAAKEHAKNKPTPAQKDVTSLQSHNTNDSQVHLKDEVGTKTEEAKSKEDIKAEREAKKQAKQASRVLAKEKMAPNSANNSSKDNSLPPPALL